MLFGRNPFEIPGKDELTEYNILHEPLWFTHSVPISRSAEVFLMVRAAANFLALPAALRRHCLFCGAARGRRARLPASPYLSTVRCVPRSKTSSRSSHRSPDG